MKLKTLSAAIAFALCSTAAMANTYQGEIGAHFGTIDAGEDDADVLGLSGEYFFDAVDTSNKPLAEAAFLQEAGGIHLSHSQIDADVAERTTTTLTVDHYFGDSIFYAGASYLNTDLTQDGEPDQSDDTWGVTAGITPVAGWLVTTTYWDNIDYELNLLSKYVTQLQGETALNFEVGYADGGDLDDTVSAGVDYYFNRKASLGVYTKSADETLTGIRGRYFFNEQFSAELNYSTIDSVDTTLIGARFRF